MVFIEKENDNSLNKTTDIEHLNSFYNMILDFLSWKCKFFFYIVYNKKIF